MRDEERAAAFRILAKDVQLLGVLLDASDDNEVTAERDTLADALEGVTQVLAKQLHTEMGCGPVDMAAVLDLAARSRWAAEQAIRIEPGLDERTGE